MVIIPLLSSPDPSWFQFLAFNLNWKLCLKSPLLSCTCFPGGLGSGIPSRAWHKWLDHSSRNPLLHFSRHWTWNSALVQATSWTKSLKVNWEITIAAVNPGVKRLTTVYPAFVLLWMTTVNSPRTSSHTEPWPKSCWISPAPSPFFPLSGVEFGCHRAARIL